MDKDLIEFESNFSVLERYGTDITKEEYVTNPAIGRDEQIKELILILLTPEKSAILIGKPGIGKTAIVEGLAYRLQKNDVPDALQGYSIVNIKTASLLGTMPSGESKVQKMIDELKTKEKLILFIDEIHMLIGATESSSLDFANIFKEGLGRGSIKVIGATTSEEYERYILRDKAFTRRFQKIEVPEPNREETIKIMMGTLPKFEKQTGRKMKYTQFIQERIMSFIVDITSEYKRIYSLGSRYPDVCLTLLKQAFSYTVYDNREYVDIFDVRKAIENSKNIYPDVIKKELPNFDKAFNDIILEEKGEKPVEEWRKDNTLTRSEIENGNHENETSDNTDDSNLDNRQSDEHPKKDPSSIILAPRKNNRFIQSPGEMKRINANKVNNRGRNDRINSLLSKNDKTFAQLGVSNISYSLKDRSSSTTDSKGLDDFLLGSDVGSLKAKKDDGPRIPKRAVITDEVRQGVNDSYLLGRPVSSTIDSVRRNNNRQEENVRYRVDNRQNNRMPNNNQNYNNSPRPVRMNINDQNFDRYNNYFHQNDYYDMNNNSYDSRNHNTNVNFNQRGPQNNYNNQQGRYPRNMPNNNYPQNNMQNNYRNGQPGRNNNYGPTVNIAKSILKMEDEERNRKETGGLVSLSLSGNESLFAPIDNDEKLSPDKVDIQKLLGKDVYDINELSSGKDSKELFGTSTHSGVSSKEKKNGKTDIFGNLMADNMRIKNGKIIDEFPTFDKLDNLSNIKSVISDVRNVKEEQKPVEQKPVEQKPVEQKESDSKKWTFLPTDDDLFGKPNNTDGTTSEETNISSATNVVEPTSNGDYNSDMKTAEFVDFSELKNGQVSDSDSNKFLGISISDNKPQFDLNIENNNVKEVDFDDFYDQ